MNAALLWGLAILVVCLLFLVYMADLFFKELMKEITRR